MDPSEGLNHKSETQFCPLLMAIDSVSWLLNKKLGEDENPLLVTRFNLMFDRMKEVFVSVNVMISRTESNMTQLNTNLNDLRIEQTLRFSKIQIKMKSFLHSSVDADLF
jgi:hypothetical protein